MNTAAMALIGLISLFVISQITSLKLDITNNLFYAPFHFTSGFLLGVLFLSLGANKVLTLFFTFSTGILWEVYEFLAWKYVIKKKKFKPQGQDTINDLFLDLMGTLLALSLLAR